MTDVGTSHDAAHMARALALAARGLYTTDPNPRVGCVVVRDGEVLGDGGLEGHAFLVSARRQRLSKGWTTGGPETSPRSPALAE